MSIRPRGTLEYLLEKGALSIPNARRALEARVGTMLYDQLVDSGLASELEVARVISNHHGAELVDLHQLDIEEALTCLSYLIPESFARQHRLVAWHGDSRSLVVALLDPMLSLDAAQGIAAMTGRDVSYVVTTRSALNQALTTAYGCQTPHHRVHSLQGGECSRWRTWAELERQRRRVSQDDPFDGLGSRDPKDIE